MEAILVLVAEFGDIAQIVLGSVGTYIGFQTYRSSSTSRLQDETIYRLRQIAEYQEELIQIEKRREANAISQPQLGEDT